MSNEPYPCIALVIHDFNSVLTFHFVIENVLIQSGEEHDTAAALKFDISTRILWTWETRKIKIKCDLAITVWVLCAFPAVGGDERFIGTHQETAGCTTKMDFGVTGDADISKITGATFWDEWRCVFWLEIASI